MSLLSEVKKTVVETDNLQLGFIGNSIFSGYQNLHGYQVITGYVEPRDVDTFLVLNYDTHQPIQLPSNIFPIKTFLIPEIPLESDSPLEDSYLQMYFYDTPEFNNQYNYNFDWGQFNGNELNTKVMLEMYDQYTTMSGYVGFPYVGFNMSGSFTAGKIRMVMYYLPATRPPLPLKCCSTNYTL